MGILKTIIKRLQCLNHWKPQVHKLNNLVRIGTKYGSWSVPEGLLTENSVCYLAGAGEDISFDVGLVEKYRCAVYVLDPTPRAKAHYDRLIEATLANTRMAVNNSKTEFYSLKKENIGLLRFLELGLWNKTDEIKFFCPKNPDHVSHSAVNLQKTNDYFMARVDRLSNIMKLLGHNELDLLKIDIEGSEYVVLESIIEDKLKVKVLNIEFDESYNPLDKDFHKRIESAVKKLIDFGYRVVDIDSHDNYTLVLGSVIDGMALK